MMFSLPSWLKRKPQRKPITPVTVKSFRFIGEQDGPVERDLKSRWVPILAAAPQIRRAFLVRSVYDGQGGLHIVLALCTSGAPDQGLMQALRVPYAAKFHRDCPLDMMFATAAQEAQIEKVCPPFYTAV
jgi:hypothetical protein